MDSKIAKLNKRAYEAEKALYAEVMKLDNCMNKCDCDSQQDACSHRHVFRNVIRHDNPYIYCLNCGGYIEPTEQ